MKKLNFKFNSGKYENMKILNFKINSGNDEYMKTIYFDFFDCIRINILHIYIQIFKQRILIKTLVQALQPLAEDITIYGHVDNLALWLVEKCTKEQVCCLVKTINIYIYKKIELFF